MSGSKGNYIGLAESPISQFRKAMKVPDDLLGEWYRLVWEREQPETDPLQAKLSLARFIVSRSWGENAALEAEERFTREDRQGALPPEIPTADVAAGSVHLPKLLSEKLGNSTSYWRRVIAQGGVRLNGTPVESLDLDAQQLDGGTLQAGRNQFLAVRVVSPAT